MPVTAALIGGGASLLGGILGGNSQKRAAQISADAQLKAAQLAAEEQRFRPVGVTTRFGRSQFQFDPSGRLMGAGYQIDPRLAAYQDRLDTLAEQRLAEAEMAPEAYAPLRRAGEQLFGLGGQYLAQTPEQVAQQYMQRQLDLLAPSRERQYAQLQNQLYQTGRGGLAVGGTGTRPGGSPGLAAANPEMEAYYNALAQQDAALAAQAQQEGQRQLAFGTGLFGQGAGLLGGYESGVTGALNPFTTTLGGVSTLESLGQQPLDLGSTLGARASTAGANSGQSLLLGGMGAYGIGQMMGRAKGGTVSSYAEGGSVTDEQNVDNILDKLSDAQLRQARNMAMSRKDVAQVAQIDQELAQRASIRSGLGNAFNAIPQERQEQMMAGGGVVAFSGDEDENEAGLGQLVGGMMPSEGNPEVYKKLTGLFPQMLANVAGARYTPMSAEKYNEAITSRRKMLEEGAGPSPYADIKEKIAAMRGDSEKELRQSRGLAALQAAAALTQGRGLAQGLGRAGGAFAESYGQALRADSAQRRSLMNMEINAADALRKERMGLNRDAIAAADQARKDHDAAQQFGIRKASALAKVAGQFATATKPTKAAGSGAPKPLKINEQLAEAEIAHETNPTNATLNRVNALRRAVAQTKTSDFGPTRAGLGEAGLEVRLGEAITEAQQKIKFTPDYLKADAAGKQKMLQDAAAGVRANAKRNSAVNINSPQGGGTRLQFDAQGNLLPG